MCTSDDDCCTIGHDCCCDKFNDPVSDNDHSVSNDYDNYDDYDDYDYDNSCPCCLQRR